MTKAGKPAAPKALRRGRAKARKKTPASGGGAGRAGALKSMRVSDGFRQFVLDQLSAVDALRAKSMFGGIGLYSDEVFFGIVAADTLYFKVDDSNRSHYESAGSQPFRPFKDRPMSMSYYTVPAEVLEATSILLEWASRSIAIASADKKSPRKLSRTAPRRSQES